MRTSSKFVLISVVIGGLLGLSAVPASAATTRKLTATFSSTTPTVSTNVTVSGRLSKSPKKSSVYVQRKSGSRWTTVKKIKTTTSKGAYKTTIKMPSTSATYAFRTYAPKKGKLKAATSKTVSVNVRRKVTLTVMGPGSPIGAGSNANVVGAMSPASAGKTITLQRLSGSTWVAVAGSSTTTAGNGSYSSTVTSPTIGTTTYRASFAGATGYAKALSGSATMTVSAVPVAPVISTTTLPSAVVGVAYSQQVHTVGNQVGTWSVTPALPAGLTLNTATGAITGTPATTGSTGLTLTFVQASNTLQDTQVITLDVVQPPAITTANLPKSSRGSTYHQQLTASGGPGTWSKTSGVLPAGLNLSSGGLVSGTPTTLGTSQFEATFTSTATGLKDARTFNLEIAELIASTALPAGTVGVPYEAFLQINGNLPGVWTSTGQSLPAGLSLDVDGRIHGTPTTAGDVGFLYFTYTPTNPAHPADTTPSMLILSIEAAGSIGPAVTQVTVGNQQACMIKADHTLWCWGYNFHGQSGRPVVLNDLNRLVPTQVGSATNWESVSSGPFFHACAVKSDHTLWCWGYNNAGQLGDGTTSLHAVPAQVPGTSWASVTTGIAHTCATTTAGSLFCWGDNSTGSVGMPLATNTKVPVNVGGTDWAKISTSLGAHTCGIKTDDTLWCWGSNFRGQAGIGTSGNYVDTPAQVGSSAWKQVATGDAHTCAVKTDDTLWCWGSNDAGEVGNGSTSPAVASPVQIGSATWRSVSAGKSTCGIKSTGTAWCWGYNGQGQLGNGSAADSLVPALVDGTLSWSSISNGDATTCGVKNDESLRCWGDGGRGQLGSGLTHSSNLPVKVQ